MSLQSALGRAGLCLLALAVSAPVLGAQSVGSPTVVATERVCPAVPDTSRFIPTAQQIGERRQLRNSLRTTARRHGTPDPRGLLFVTVDSTRQGRVLFLETNLTSEGVQQATRQVGDYLQTLEVGRNFQMLVRMEGDDPVMAAGKRHCPPALRNGAEIDRVMRAVLDRHPDAGKPEASGRRRALLRVVVNAEGNVAFVDVDRPSGDAFIDRFVEEIGTMLKFAPATLDGVPFDARIRYTLTFGVN